jgi:hypothetical protein
LNAAALWPAASKDFFLIRPLKLDGAGIAILRVEDSNVSSCAPLLATAESQVEFE